MRALAFLAAAAFASVFGATPAQADQLVIQRNVTVREMPRRTSGAVDYPAPGTALQLLDDGARQYGYYHVRLADGREGWVYQTFVRRVTDSVPDPSPPPPPPGSNALSVHFIDVGQGDSTLILCPNGATMLIDAGSTSGRSPDEVRDYVTSQIAPLGGDIDYLIVSHPDGDHYNLLRPVLAGIDVGLAYYVGQRTDYADRSAYDWVVRTPGRAVRLGPQDFDRQATPNASIDCGAAKVWILAAAVQATASAKNAMSIVVMVRMGDFETVITGDATFDTERVILGRYTPAWLDIDVLRVGHHGSRATSTQQRWADVLRPERAIFSSGHRNSYGHPHRDVVTRLAAKSETVSAHPFRDATGSHPNFTFHDHAAYREGLFSTAASGTIVIRTDGNGYRLETAR